MLEGGRSTKNMPEEANFIVQTVLWEPGSGSCAKQH